MSLLAFIPAALAFSTAPERTCSTIAELAASTESLSTLLDAVSAADPAVLTLLSSPDATLTVFAPTNNAFAAIPSDVLNGVLANQPALTKLLQKHVVDSVVPSAAAILLEDASVPTLAGEDITIDGSGGTGPVTVTPTILGGKAEVVNADIEACNGVVHIVDKVILSALVQGDEFFRTYVGSTEQYHPSGDYGGWAAEYYRFPMQWGPGGWAPSSAMMLGRGYAGAFGQNPDISYLRYTGFDFAIPLTGDAILLQGTWERLDVNGSSLAGPDGTVPWETIGAYVITRIEDDPAWKINWLTPVDASPVGKERAIAGAKAANFAFFAEAAGGPGYNATDLLLWAEKYSAVPFLNVPLQRSFNEFADLSTLPLFSFPDGYSYDKIVNFGSVIAYSTTVVSVETTYSRHRADDTVISTGKRMTIWHKAEDEPWKMNALIFDSNP